MRLLKSESFLYYNINNMKNIFFKLNIINRSSRGSASLQRKAEAAGHSVPAEAHSLAAYSRGEVRGSSGGARCSCSREHAPRYAPHVVPSRSRAQELAGTLAVNLPLTSALRACVAYVAYVVLKQAVTKRWLWCCAAA
jgi:hypothetical protein